MLTWDKPVVYRPGYRYLVKWSSSLGTINKTETDKEVLNVNPLIPGSPYNYSVTTVTLDGTESDAVDLSNCTSMSIKVYILCLFQA